MLKSLFSRLLTGYLVIFVLILTTFSAALSLIYQDFIFAEKHRTLRQGAMEVNRQVGRFYMEEITKDDLDLAMDSIGYSMDSRVYVLSLDKESLASQSGLGFLELESGNLVADLLKIMDGEEVFRTREYAPVIDTYVVFYGVPLTVRGEIIGAVLQYFPVDQIRSEILKVYGQIWRVGGVITLVSAAAIYFFVRRVSKPLKEMEIAASKLASGEVVEDIPGVKSSDEVGKLVKAFNTMKKELANMEYMRRDFIAGISHELRTPLTSILGFIQGMRDGLVAEEEREAVLDIIQDETRRMIRMTGEILEMVKLETGSEKLYPETFDVLEAAAFLLESLKIHETRPNLNVVLDIPRNLPAFADADRFRQIMINLINNAMKYTDDGGSIYISAGRAEDMIEVRIKDTGRGISQEQLPYIFERFYRADKSRHAATGGAGLGLNIVRSLVGLHGGDIRVWSQLGEGSEFVFTIPASN
jgi:signal transduction histidine kinase